MKYQHTQRGTLIIFVIFAVMGIFGFTLYQEGFDILMFLLMGIILLILLSFISITVSINDTYLQVKFGYGIYKKNFSLHEIQTVKQVKNKGYYGWGIRFWFYPKMVIFNISGYDAVEIKMLHGKVYRIGTDEPEQLEKAILETIKLVGNK